MVGIKRSNLKINNMIKERDGYLPHQQRVVDEYIELAVKVTGLNNFVTVSPIYQQLDKREKELLLAQLGAMKAYESILRLRITAF